MTREQEQQALSEVMEQEPIATPDEMQVFKMFEAFMNTQPTKNEEVVNLPRGFGQ